MHVITKKPTAKAMANRLKLFTAINAILAADYMPEASGALNEITAINAAIITESSFQQPLTTFAVGWHDDEGNLDAESEFFGPAVQVPERFTYEQKDNAEQFYSDFYDDVRAPRSDFKQVEYTSEKINANTVNRGLQIVVDIKEANLNGAEYYVGMLMQRLKRNKLRRKIALLSAGAYNTAKTWDASAGKDPDSDVSGDLITAGDTSGVSPNRAGFGLTAWQKRFVSLRAQTAPALAASAALNEEQLAGMLGLDKVLRSKARYTSAADVRSQAVANLVLMFTASAGATKDDSSNIKDFWSACESGGGQYAVHQWNIGSKMVGFAVEHYELIKLTSTLGIRKFTIS